MTVSKGNLVPLRDSNWLNTQYTVAGRSTPDIARELGCNPTTVSNALIRHGIAVRPKGVQRVIGPLDDTVWLREQYATRSAEQIAVELATAGHPAATQTVRRRLYEAKIDTRAKGIRAGAVPQAHLLLDDPVWLKARYVEENHTVREIAVLSRAGSNRVRAALRDAGVPLRKAGRRPTDLSRP